MPSQRFEIRAEWDEEAGVWIATSDDVPGLCAEAATFDELVDTVLALVPEFLVANQVVAPDQAREIPVRVTAERRAVARHVA